MSRRPAAFTRAEFKRAIDAILSAGLPVSRIEFNRTGGFVVAMNVDPGTGDDALNRELAAFRKKHDQDCA